MIIKDGVTIVGRTDNKQNELVAGDNITMQQDPNTGKTIISAGGSNEKKMWGELVVISEILEVYTDNQTAHLYNNEKTFRELENLKNICAFSIDIQEPYIQLNYNGSYTTIFDMSSSFNYFIWDKTETVTIEWEGTSYNVILFLRVEKIDKLKLNLIVELHDLPQGLDLINPNVIFNLRDFI